MPAPNPSDIHLANRLAARDVNALAEFYDQFGGLAYSVALRILGDPGRAEDVVQESFLKLWNSAAHFNPGLGSLRTWLTTAVRNRSIDYLRGRAGHERQELELFPDVTSSSSSSQDPWLEVAAALEGKVLREAVDSLPPEQQQVIDLAYFGGYTGPEIAKLIQVPLSTVKGRMRLALEKLYSYLKGKRLELSN
ncbi:MAG: RNA polymerase sigma factor [Candidatus Dormibacteraceae bacterium]